MKYDILSPVAPEMPNRLPACVKHTISKVPKYMFPAAANALFPQFAAQLKNVKFRYIDNVLREASVVSMHGTVAPSGFGKGYIDPMLEAIVRYQREHDKESYRKLAEYTSVYRSKSQSQAKPERPKDAAILVPEPDMTNPALIQLAMDAERENNSSMSLLVPEVDLLDQMCGGHRKVTKVIRLNFDTKRYGAQRATADGISGNPYLRLKINFSCVEGKAQTFFKDCLTDGTLGRITISYVRKTDSQRREIPRQGNYDEAYLTKLDEYLVRLRSASGEVRVPHIDKLIKRLMAEFADIAELADDELFESFAHRSLMMAWARGCILYIAEGFRWTKEIEHFVEWSLYYDAWSKLAVFAQLMRKSERHEVVDMRKYGPVNMLDLLPDSFTRDMLEKLRESLGKSLYCTPQITTWIGRGYITSDVNNLYTKTETYLATHPSNPAQNG